MAETTTTVVETTEDYPAWIANLGGRKFMLAAFILLACTVLLAVGKIDVATWERMSLWVLGLYGTANVAQKATTKATD